MPSLNFYRGSREAAEDYFAQLLEREQADRDWFRDYAQGAGRNALAREPSAVPELWLWLRSHLATRLDSLPVGAFPLWRPVDEPVRLAAQQVAAAQYVGQGLAFHLADIIRTQYPQNPQARWMLYNSPNGSLDLMHNEVIFGPSHTGIFLQRCEFFCGEVVSRAVGLSRFRRGTDYTIEGIPKLFKGLSHELSIAAEPTPGSASPTRRPGTVAVAARQTSSRDYWHARLFKGHRSAMDAPLTGRPMPSHVISGLLESCGYNRVSDAGLSTTSAAANDWATADSDGDVVSTVRVTETLRADGAAQAWLLEIEFAGDPAHDRRVPSRYAPELLKRLRDAAALLGAKLSTE